MFVRYTRPGAVVIVLMVSLLAVTGGDLATGVGRVVTDGVAACAKPVQRLMGWGGAPTPVMFLKGKESLRDQIEELQRQNAELKESVVVVKNIELEAENIRLRSLLEFRRSVQFDTVPARVIGKDYSYLTIDRGMDAGIGEQMCAMTNEGVVGRVLSAGGRTSKILLMWDSNNRLGGIVQRSRVQGIVEGDQEGRFIMKYLEANADVKRGDLVVTSGEGGVFPKGLAVGTVAAVTRRGGELFQTAALVPAADLDRLEEVLVAVVRESEPTDVTAPLPDVDAPTPDTEPPVSEPATS